MSKMEHDLSKLSPAQRRLLEDIEKQLQEAVERVNAQTPEHLKRLGKILRRSIETGSLVKLRRFLKEHDVEVPRRDIECFRDHLIIHRIDLKDLEPAARARLFARAHAKEDPRNMSPSYRASVAQGIIPSCRDCRWFVTAPNDGEGDHSGKSCVELGTKGADIACYGFTYKAN
jgi:hypothetical protein